MLEGFFITAKGSEYFAKAAAGKKLKFTIGKFGSGVLDEAVNPATVTEMVEPLGTLPITKIKTEGDKATITTAFSNRVGNSILTEFNLTEVGLYGRVETEDGVVDPEGTEALLLYSYTTPEKSDFVPATLTEYIITFPIVIAGSANVTAVIDESLVYVTHKEFEELGASLIDGVNSIKTYASLEELGLDKATATMLDIIKAMPPNSMLMFEMAQETYNREAYPKNYGSVRIYRTHHLRVSCEFDSITSSANTSVERFIGNGICNGDSSLWSGWQRDFNESHPPTAEQTGALPNTGGTLATGTQTILGIKNTNSGGGARILFSNADGNLGGLGFSAAKDVLRRYSKDLSQTYAVYDEGNKPTASDLGVISSDPATRVDIPVGTDIIEYFKTERPYGYYVLKGNSSTSANRPSDATGWWFFWRNVIGTWAMNSKDYDKVYLLQTMNGNAVGWKEVAFRTSELFTQRTSSLGDAVSDNANEFTLTGAMLTSGSGTSNFPDFFQKYNGADNGRKTLVCFGVGNATDYNGYIAYDHYSNEIAMRMGTTKAWRRLLTDNNITKGTTDIGAGSAMTSFIHLVYEE